MENGFEALAKAFSDASASFEHLAKAIRQSENQCGYIKPKRTRPVYRKEKNHAMDTARLSERERDSENDRDQ